MVAEETSAGPTAAAAAVVAGMAMVGVGGDAARAVALVGTVAWAARSVAWAARLVVPAVAMVAVAVAVGKAARAVAPEKQHTHPARICVHTWLERGRRSPTLSGDASG